MENTRLYVAGSPDKLRSFPMHLLFASIALGIILLILDLVTAPNCRGGEQ